ncbi:glucuronyl esterase domain-containing protein [Chengkuizengella axinellae]|uniref:Acetylxylan esterase n=1 Tax=Chengkuizengella axinellae TaxID=3064388 RepID=A0ABT9ITJ5_9BACL|nr:acetylxylan esterase [Chengkuizengella sp. 2205SS18-9]MDP5272658.1 acetylxylan esterase [Chengkuizengella sp. 2205SS18-9]
MQESSITKHLIEESGERKLPDPLYTNAGEQIISTEQWESNRRPELLEMFKEHIYGRSPVNRPDSLSFNVVETKSVMEGNAVLKKVDISFEGPGGKGIIHLKVFVPTNLKKPAPAFVLINKFNDEQERKEMWGYSPEKSMIERGYGAVFYCTADVDPDEHDEFKNGVHGIYDEEQRPSDAWGTIAAWAWGASRVMDYLETDTDIDSDKVAIVGHSRSGKTALWTGALDERFAFVISNESGSTGAAISRGKIGETINQINTKFPHWFNDNYKSFNDREFELPVDQHMLLSMIAPRPIYVASASEDLWCDPESEFLSLSFATSVYQLYGFKGLGTKQPPPIDSPIIGDQMGYHNRYGKHKLKEYDLVQFMNFWDGYFEKENGHKKG